MDMNLIAIFVAVMVGAICCFWKIRHQQVNSVASVVTVIGVLGTFVGIFVGLWNFDAEKINESVPELLAGLKLAFGTSIVGIGFSVLLKADALRVKMGKSEETSYTGATVDDLANLLRNILEVEQEEG